MKQIDVAIAVIARGRQILICQRKQGDSFGGFWEFPGGKREPGESLEEALSRELREELDVTAPPLAALTPIEHRYPQVRLRLCPYLCKLTEGEPRAIASQQTRWVDALQLRDFRFPPANESLIEEIIRRVTSA